MDVLDLMAVLSLKSDDYDKGMDDASKKASSVGSKIGNGLANVAKVGAAALATAAAGVTALTTASTKAYAEYEQLAGGVETLFKESADIIMAYADRAYKTAGLSANEYMETVTSFSASLLQSLSGNTQQAAGMANLAITDMSDNANKMGTSMESIQNAYQGFAKQNYTMLDNLKLGYGGTQSEMKRLIEDAEALDDTFKATRDENNDLAMSFSDIVKAIHIVQTELGITGTTAKEAATTISGSLNSMKSAWQNVLTGIADENADFGSLMDNLVDSSSIFISNIIPRVEVAIEGVGKLISGLAPVIAKELPSLIENVAPGLIDAAMSLIESLSKVLPQLLPVIVKGVKTLISSLMKYLPDLLDVIKDILISVVDEVSNSTPELISTLIEIVVKLIERLLENLPLILDSILDAITKIADYILKEGLPKILEKLPEIITGIAKFIIESIPKIFVAVVQVVSGILKQLPTIIQMIVQMIPEIITALIPALIEAIPDLVVGFVELFSAFLIAVPLIIVEIVKALPEIITGIISGLEEHWPEITAAFQNLIPEMLSAFSSTETASAIQENIATFFTNLWTKITEFFTMIGGAVEEFFRPAIEKIVAIWNWFDETFGPLINAFKELISTIFQAINVIVTRIWNAITEKIKEAWDNIWGKISPIIEKIKEKVRIGFEFVYNKIKEPLNKVKTFISDTFSNIKDTFLDLVDKAKTWGLDLIENFIGGIKEKVSALTDTIKNVSQSIKDFIGFSEPKKGPLSDFHTYAPDMMELFAKGIADNEKVISDQIDKSFDFSDRIVDVQKNQNDGIISSKSDNQIIELLKKIADKDYSVIVEGNEDNMFRVIRKKNNEYFDKTGNYAFLPI